MHPEAVRRFNDVAESLVGGLVAVRPENAVAESFPSEVPVAAEFHIGKEVALRGTEIDGRGETVARFIEVDGLQYTIRGDAYQSFSSIAERIAVERDLRDSVSMAFVEDALFEWIAERFRRKASSALIPFLLDKSQALVKQLTIWTPIDEVEVQDSFPIGQAEIRPISNAVIEGWLATANLPPTLQATIADKHLRRFRGRAAVVTTLIAEREYAAKRALEIAVHTCHLLALSLPAMVVPAQKCYALPIGMCAPDEFHCAIESDGKFDGPKAAFIGDPSSKFLRLSREATGALRLLMVDELTRLVRMASRSDLQERILAATMLCAKAAYTDDPTEKTVLTLSSLEAFLLRDGSEPIQQNLAERMALFVGTDLSERRNIVSTVRSVYEIRSRYLHHGLKRAQAKDVASFLMYARSFYVKLLKFSGACRTRLEFLSTLDDAKMNGPTPFA